MQNLISHCPSCQGDVQVTKLECQDCHTRFEGQFPIPAILRLSQEDQRFILSFILKSGSLKDMAKEMKLSYPTVRNHLDRIIDSLKEFGKSSGRDRREILVALEKGNITAKEAVKRLKSMEI